MPYEELAGRKGGPMDEDRQVAVRLREVRRARGVTQIELGDALGVSFQQIQKYERCMNRISAGRLFRAAQALDADVATFFAGMESPGARDVELDFAAMTDADLSDMRAYFALPTEMRRAFGGLFSAIVSGAQSE